jgi:hypothetical protein
VKITQSALADLLVPVREAGALLPQLSAAGRVRRFPLRKWFWAGAGVRVGRKTYLVDGAPAEERPLYVALSNSLVGVITLASGGFGLVAEGFGVPALLLIFTLLIGLGIIVAWRMPEAERRK